MTRATRTFLAAALAALFANTASIADATAAAPAPQPPLSDYTGIYAYRDGATVAIVPKGEGLIAIVDEGLYQLRRVAGDEFRNGVGQKVEFVRGERGEVRGVKEVDDFFARQSTSVPREVIALTIPCAPCAPYVYRIPDKLTDGLEVGPAAGAGFPVGTLEEIARAIINETYPQVHSVLLWRDGRLVFEEYDYGHDRDRAHQMRSATKSFHSALVGIAIARGKIRDEKQPIVELLPWPASSYANPDPRKAKITVADLLSMRTGLACDDRDEKSPGNEQRIYAKPDWARFTMDLPMAADPGTVAHYCSGGVHVAARLVEKATGGDIRVFAKENLFDPLGFTGYKWPWEPVAANTGTFGEIFLRPRDMLKFGILYLEGGRWQGRQIIPEDWVKRSTAPLSKIGTREYGYLWWRQTFPITTGGQTRNVETILASGNGGQKIFIVPSLRLVAVFTGGNYNSEKDSPPNEIMGNVIFPALLQAGK
jgi:CubicO group peptidase (beta-lactamase class C family)